MDNNKRRIPRHVDGRLKVGMIYWKVFAFKFCPLAIILLVLFFSNPNPLTLFLCVSLGAGLLLGFSELNNRETGFEILKTWVKYKRQGRIYYERSTINEQSIIRCIRNNTKPGQQSEKEPE